MNTYHIIHANGSVIQAEWAGRLEYACIPYKDIRKFLDPLGRHPEDITVEHVSVLWHGQRAHMFVDENGLAKQLGLNPKATRVYWNNTLLRRGHPELVYDDLDQDPSMPLVDILLAELNPIVGSAVLWEGEME